MAEYSDPSSLSELRMWGALSFKAGQLNVRDLQNEWICLIPLFLRNARIAQLIFSPSLAAV